MRVPGGKNLDTTRIVAGTASVTPAKTAAGADQFALRIAPEQAADLPVC